MKKNMGLVFFTVFLYLLGFGVIIPILPLLSKNFGASAFQTGLLMSVYSFMQFFFAPMWGRLSDKKGRRPILIYCLLGEGLSYILFAYARSWEVLMIARALAGFFAASISTASAYISDITPENERSKGMALIGMAFGLGFVIGPALGGGLSTWAHHISDAPHFDTTFTLLWVSALCLGTFVFAFKFLQESLNLSDIQNGHFHHQEKRNRIQTLLHYTKMSHIGPLILSFGLLSLAMSAMEATLVLHVDQKFNWGIHQVSYGFAYIGMVMIFTQGYLVRRLIPKLGENKLIPVGMSLFILGMLGIGMSPSIPALGVSMTLFAIGNGLANPSLLGSISLMSPASEQGLIFGVTQSFASLGRILGPAIGGMIFQRFYSNTPFYVSGVLALIGFGLVLMNYKFIPSSGKKKTKIGENELDLLSIGEFQLQNLITNRIPFLLLHLSGKLEFSNLSTLEKSHLDTVLRNVSSNWKPTSLIDENYNTQNPIVVCSANPTEGLQVCQSLISIGYKNSYYFKN